MEDLHRSDAARRERGGPEAPTPAPEQAAPVPTPEQAVPKPAVEVGEPTVAARPVDPDRVANSQDRATASNSVELSDSDRRLLLTLSSFTQDRKTLTENVREGMDPMEREFQHERLDLDEQQRDVLTLRQ